jgi:regulator of protease activity HflC (stomatin/prohibitin superfamily)
MLARRSTLDGPGRSHRNFHRFCDLVLGALSGRGDIHSRSEPTCRKDQLWARRTYSWNHQPQRSYFDCFRRGREAALSIPPGSRHHAGGPYFKWPWQKIYKVSVATQTVNVAFDPDSPGANQAGTVVEAVTKDQLNTGLTGQIRYHISERNLYAYIFAIKRPISHVVGYFVSVLRERIATFEAPAQSGSAEAATSGVSINDLRRNLRDLNEHMDRECSSSEARYGIVLDASLITGIDPPPEVESALAAINTAHNMVSSDISLAQATADQRIEQSKRAAEIETLKAQAEVQPLVSLASQLAALKTTGEGALRAYVRNVRLGLFGNAQQVIVETKQ